MQNQIPGAWKPLRSMAEMAIGGLHALQTTVGVKQNTETAVQGDLTPALTAYGIYQESKQACLDAIVAQKGADAQGKATMRVGRDVLKRTLGARYSRAWDAVGFNNHSLALPAKLDGRLALLDTMRAYLVAHPQLEVEALGVTMLAFEMAHAALREAMLAVAAAQAAQAANAATRDSAVVALQRRLRALINELAGLLGPLDPRWKQFGFNPPASDSVPDAPGELSVSTALPRCLELVWDRSAGADRYHVYQQVVGADPDPVLARTTSNLDAVLNTFATGAQVRVWVSALNGAGESVRTPPVEVVVG